MHIKVLLYFYNSGEIAGIQYTELCSSRQWSGNYIVNTDHQNVCVYAVTVFYLAFQFRLVIKKNGIYLRITFVHSE